MPISSPTAPHEKQTKVISDPRRHFNKGIAIPSSIILILDFKKRTPLGLDVLSLNGCLFLILRVHWVRPLLWVQFKQAHPAIQRVLLLQHPSLDHWCHLRRLLQASLHLPLGLEMILQQTIFQFQTILQQTILHLQMTLQQPILQLQIR